MSELRRLVGEGFRAHQIASVLGRTHEAVVTRMRRHEIASQTKYIRHGKTPVLYATSLALTAIDNRKSCVNHLIDLRRAYGVLKHEPTAKGIAAYRAKNEINNPPSDSVKFIPQTWFIGSVVGSSAQSCADA